jgi:arylsulfatase A-like enzyme
MTENRLSRRDFLKLLSLAPASFVHLPARSDKSRSSPLPNILIVLFDALSARHLPLYGYPRQTSPQLERLAAKATVFHRHYAAANFTSPGVASILSGLYPWSHRALNIGGSIDLASLNRNLFYQLGMQYNTFTYTHNTNANILLDQLRHYIDDYTPTHKLCLFSTDLADMYAQKDFTTATNAQSLALWRPGFSPSSFLLSRFNRLRQYYMNMRLNRKYIGIYPRGVPNFYLNYFTIETAVDWLQNQTRQQPQPHLAYFHLVPPHSPYTTRADFMNRFADGWKSAGKPTHFFAQYPESTLEEQRQYYDESIAYVDAEFGRLFDNLEQGGILNNTVLIFTSDHGEMFERGIIAHDTPVLYEAIIRTPLLIWRPGLSQRQDIYTPTNAVDLLPTLLSLAGQPIPEWCEGRVLPTFPGAAPEAERSIFAVEAKENAQHKPLYKVTLAMIKGRYKLIYYLGYKGYSDIYEMYDLQEDPEELLNIYPTSPLAADLMAEMKAKLDTVNSNYVGEKQ